MKIRDAVEMIPDPIKVGTSVSPAVLTIAGIPVEQWTFILSGIVSVLFIIEKLPRVINVIKQFTKWIRSRKTS